MKISITHEFITPLPSKGTQLVYEVLGQVFTITNEDGTIASINLPPPGNLKKIKSELGYIFAEIIKQME